MHCRGIVHRDIKPDNILMTRDKNGELVCKLGDFGEARYIPSISASALIDGHPAFTQKGMTGFHGNQATVAPDMLETKRRRGKDE